MINIVFELANSKTIHFRKTLAIWDWIAYVGGFGVSLWYLGTWVYKTAKQN
jgi:type IV secretory pathway TrbD component